MQLLKKTCCCFCCNAPFYVDVHFYDYGLVVLLRSLQTSSILHKETVNFLGSNIFLKNTPFPLLPLQQLSSFINRGYKVKGDKYYTFIHSKFYDGTFKYQDITRPYYQQPQKRLYAYSYFFHEKMSLIHSFTSPKVFPSPFRLKVSEKVSFSLLTDIFKKSYLKNFLRIDDVNYQAIEYQTFDFLYFYNLVIDFLKKNNIPFKKCIYSISFHVPYYFGIHN